MGVVFEGFDPSLNREVAIKMISPELANSEDSRTRFAREAQSLASIRSENVVGVFDFGEADGLPYLVMEYVHGRSLEEIVEQSGPLSIEEILSYSAQIARGLAAIHDRGIVHRDIKPANVMIEEHTLTAKISDFGLARGREHVNLTQAGMLVGSPLFMSPEQLDGHPVDPRSDLFSLGSVLYGIAVGQLPFDAPNVTTIFRKIVLENPVEPIQIRPELPVEFNTLVMALLRKNPRERIADARSVVDIVMKIKC